MLKSAYLPAFIQNPIAIRQLLMPSAQALQKKALKNTPGPYWWKSESRTGIKDRNSLETKMLSDVMMETSEGKIKTAWQG